MPDKKTKVTEINNENVIEKPVGTIELDSKGTYTFNGKTVEFHYCSSPTPMQAVRPMNTVVNGVIDVDVYNPILKDLFTSIALIGAFTDITLPLDVFECEKFLIDIDSISLLKGIFSDEFFATFTRSVDEKIEFMKLRVANSSSLDDLFMSVTKLINQYSEAFEGLDMNDMMNKFSEVSKLVNVPREDMIKSILEFEHKQNK